MTTYKILYWRDIPTQIRAEDDSDSITLPLDERFLKQVDIAAAKLGLQAEDAYLAQWKWGEECEREGDARTVAEAVKAQLERQTF